MTNEIISTGLLMTVSSFLGAIVSMSLREIIQRKFEFERFYFSLVVLFLLTLIASALILLIAKIVALV